MSKYLVYTEQNIFAIQQYAATTVGEGVFSTLTTCLAVAVSAPLKCLGGRVTARCHPAPRPNF